MAYNHQVPLVALVGELMNEQMSPMTFAAMSDLIAQRVTSRGAYEAETNFTRRHPRVRVTSPDAPEMWAEIELGDEVFFLRVDAGFNLVDSELWAEEQAELLEELANVAVEYLRGNFSYETKGSLVGRKRRTLRIRAAGSDHVLAKNRGS